MERVFPKKLKLISSEEAPITFEKSLINCVTIKSSEIAVFETKRIFAAVLEVCITADGSEKEEK